MEFGAPGLADVCVLSKKMCWFWVTGRRIIECLLKKTNLSGLGSVKDKESDLQKPTNMGVTMEEENIRRMWLTRKSGVFT